MIKQGRADSYRAQDLSFACFCARSNNSPTTGYSSLSYLKKFDIDYLKIDQSFVRNLGTDKNDIALSEAIIVMAHKLGLKVIAEGVETVLQRNMLKNAGCDYAQGYLFSKPVPSGELEKLLLRKKADQVVKLHVEED